MIRFTGERCVPYDDDMQDWAYVMRDHLFRYAFASQFCSGKNVVDLGCGTGYGTWILRYLANYVVGVDVDPETVQWARNNFGRDGLHFDVVDLMVDEVPEADVYVCLEVLEHLTDPKVVLQKLKRGSLLVWSMPVDDPGRYHYRAYSNEEIRSMMQTTQLFAQIDGGFLIPYTPNMPCKYLVGVKQID